MPEPRNPYIDDRLYNWLKNYGFRDNPFSTSDAESEAYIETVFYDTGDQGRIYGNPQSPQTIILFAGRGCGKTAQRRMVESKSSPRKIDSDILAFTYNLSNWRKSVADVPTQGGYILSFVQQGLDALITAISTPTNPVAEKLDVETMELIVDIGLCLSPQLFSSFTISQKLKALLTRANVSFDEIRRSVENRSIREIFINKGLEKPGDLKLAEFYEMVVNSKKQKAEMEPYDGLLILLRIIANLDFRAMYILMDGLDDIYIDHPGKTWMDYLRPLLSDLELLRLDRLAFKFFIPLELRNELISKPWFRADKLAEYELTFSWTKEQLQQLLANRLRAFHATEDGHKILESICEPKLAAVIVEQMAERAFGIPRNMILLGQKLFYVHCKKEEVTELLSFDEWEQAQAEFFASAEFIGPYLEIGEHVVKRMGHKLDLTANELKFLNCLVQNGGTASKELLVEYIYESKNMVASDQQLSSLVKRLRDKLGGDGKNSIYIHTENRQGFELKLWRKTDR